MKNFNPQKVYRFSTSFTVLYSTLEPVIFFNCFSLCAAAWFLSLKKNITNSEKSKQFFIYIGDGIQVLIIPSCFLLIFRTDLCEFFQLFLQYCCSIYLYIFWLLNAGNYNYYYFCLLLT